MGAATLVASCDRERAVAFWDYVRILWPIASVITPLLIAVAMLWLRTQFALKTELSNERKRLDEKNARQDASIIDHETRLQLIEKDCANPPTRHELSTKLGEVAGRLGGVEAAVGGIRDQLTTTNDYLQAVVEQGMRR